MGEPPYQTALSSAHVHHCLHSVRCYGLLWMPVDAGECGHLFCRSCLQLSRRATSNRCPVCRATVTLPSGFQPNAALMHIERTHLPLEWARAEAEQCSNAAETAIANLLFLGAALGMGDRLAFNAAGSCCLLVDGEFLMHVTLLPGKRLFVYAPLLDGLRAHQLARLALCERILLGALESDEDVPGSVGILREQQLIIYHREVDLRDAAHDALRLMCAAFVGAVKRWRQRLQEVLHTVEGVCLAVPCDRSLQDFIADFNGAVAAWRTRLREIANPAPPRPRTSPRCNKCKDETSQR